MTTTTTTTIRLIPVSSAPRRGDESVLHAEREPIYTQLVQQWEAAGRLVPGRYDEEWTALTNRAPWPGR
ncbi:hypothetical protein [Streptomyces sp. NPDC050504]|uniref:hypothetical protein n=1 Tax=Streptomyces sp. NPDC050504 TaxID=3365618 RepID=UPI0037B28E66